MKICFTNARPSAAVCESILANVRKLVRKLTHLLTHACPCAAVCKLIFDNVHRLVGKLQYFLTNIRPSAAICKLNFDCCPALLPCCPALLPALLLSSIPAVALRAAPLPAVPVSPVSAVPCSLLGVLSLIRPPVCAASGSRSRFLPRNAACLGCCCTLASAVHLCRVDAPTS